MKKYSLVLLLALSGCSLSNEPEKTSLEIQAIQMQEFETNKEVGFNSVMSVLQDLGFIIQSASLSTGFITAESPAKQIHSFWSILGGVAMNHKIAVTASVESIGKKTKIRLNFVEKASSSSQYGQISNNDSPVLDPLVYQDTFNKIGDAIFIRKAQK